MEIKYKFVTGEEIYIPVYGDFEKIILELDRNLYNNNRRETRRHISLSELSEDKQNFVNNYINSEEYILNKISRKTLYKAIAQLRPDKQKLLHSLYLSRNPMTQKQYADALGVTENAIQLRLSKAKKKLKRIMSSNF